MDNDQPDSAHPYPPDSGQVLIRQDLTVLQRDSMDRARKRITFYWCGPGLPEMWTDNVARAERYENAVAALDSYRAVFGPNGGWFGWPHGIQDHPRAVTHDSLPAHTHSATLSA